MGTRANQARESATGKENRKGKEMKITVKSKHIYKGRRDDSDDCPVALAASEAFGKSASCEYSRIYLDEKEYKIPKYVTIKIANFDEGKAMKPFSFIARLVKK